jgi:hypothetical protein
MKTAHFTKGLEFILTVLYISLIAFFLHLFHNGSSCCLGTILDLKD